MNKAKCKISLLLILISLPALVIAGAIAPWPGKVVGVTDGDTLTIMRQGRGVCVRLAEIDCPEKRQPFGAMAKQFASDQCFKKTVIVNPIDVDRYGRVVGHVVLSDGRILNEELIKAGLAWQYRKYSTSKKLENLEANARSKNVGIWSDPKAMPPWEWRKNKRENSTSKNTITTSNQSGVYHGNIKSKVLHSQSCWYYNCKNCTVVFDNRARAMASGFRACKICKP